MKTFTEKEWVDMQETLQEIAVGSENKLQWAERSYQAIETTLLKIKEFILVYEFKDQAEEIHFFKEVKPQFLSELIFFMKVFYIEASKPPGDKGAQVSYYKQAAERINLFFERNPTFYIYYRMRRSDHDPQYFVRTVEKSESLPEYSLDIDPRFTTIHSYKLAKMQAYERLNDYIQQELHLLEHPELSFAAEGKKKGRSFWTDTKAALIELAYAIHSRGCVNHGKGDIKVLISDLEILFNVQVGNFYRTMQNMRIRKKTRTPFLDNLKESLENWMDDTDLNLS